MKGLSAAEAQKKQEQDGKNEIKEENKKTWYSVLFAQINNVLIWILLVAATISLFVNKQLEFYFIIGIILIIAAMGFIQEWRAEKAMEQLKQLAKATVQVYRDGKITELPSEELVEGDIIRLDMGDKIPADAQVLESAELRVDESILTGESKAVAKKNKDDLFSGTIVVHGRAEAVITKTGMRSELGKIAKNMQQTETISPLQKKINRLGRTLGIIAVCTSIFVLIYGLSEGVPFEAIIIITLALTVATVPEALPLTLTLTLSIGMREMANKKAIVKKMLAVEGLGSTTVICTDKTGTLTKNEMTITTVYVDGKEYDITGTGYQTDGAVLHANKKVSLEQNQSLQELVRAGMLCNNAILNDDQTLAGDPTEGAFIVLAHKTNLIQEQQKSTRKEEYIFTSERKMMTTIHSSAKQLRAYTKGAPEIILEKCSHILIQGEKKKLTKEQKQQILQQNKTYAEQALRVLAVAYKPEVQGPYTKDSVEKELVFLGLAGMIDPARDEVPQAIKDAHTAGIRVKMITGDNPLTAAAIAKQIGLTENPRVLTGSEIDSLSDEEFAQVIAEVDIYARTKPEHKLRIVTALQANGEIVAMTGDGVNDAPAIKKADVGVGMGIKGTDITKESADIILQDDNFQTIVTAVEDGRRIYDNIEKFTTYLISRNFTEVTIILIVASIFGFEYLPLLAVQILFLNVIGQEFPAIALGLDPATKGIMQRAPRNPNQGLLHKRNMFLITSMALFMALAGVLVYTLGQPLEFTAEARTMLFATLIVMIIIHSFNFRSLTQSIFTVGFFKNKWILASTAFSIPLLLATIYVPLFAGWFEHVPLGAQQWMIVLGGAVATFFFIEILKKIGMKLFTKYI